LTIILIYLQLSS